MERMLPQDLAARLGNSPGLASGRLHVLNLDKLEKHFEERWPKVRERALAVIEQTLLAGLGPNDLHYKAGDTNWLMFFPALDKVTAQTRCGMLAERIYRRLIGDDVRFDDVSISTVVIETDGRVLMEAADPLALLQSALDAAAAAAAEPEAPARRWQPRVEDEPETFPTDIRFRFVPALDVERGVINTYVCLPWREAAGGIPLTGHGVLLTGERSPLTGELDRRRLEVTLAAIKGLRERGEMAVIATAVHCRSLETSDARRGLLALFETVSDDDKRLLAVDIAGLPDGAPTARIGYAAHFLKRFCRAVSVTRPLRLSRPERMEGSGAFALAVSLGNMPHTEQSAGAAMDKFVQGGNRHHLKTLVFGLLTPALVARAMIGGAAYVSGDGLLPPQAAPMGFRRFDCDGFLRQLDAQRALQVA